MRSSRPIRLALVTLVTASAPLASQVLDLTVNNSGIAIGDKPEVNGLRMNFRDRNLRKVNGINLTIWNPYQPPTGTVNGLALGLPMTGARDINGVAAGIIGGGAEHALTGLGLGAIGVGSGGEMRGIMLGGIGVGSGGGITGLSVGGIGVGSGGRLRGIQIGGIGVGSGGDVEGISIGGIGVGGGGKVKGLAIGGVGVGSGSDVTGLMIGGVGVGSGGTLRGVAIGGVGVGAPRINGLVISAIAAGGQDLHAIVLAGAYFKVDERGRFDGGSLSAVNNIRGEQHGLTLGLFNYARELHGAQVGLINISDNGGRRRVLPVISVR